MKRIATIAPLLVALAACSTNKHAHDPSDTDLTDDVQVSGESTINSDTSQNDGVNNGQSDRTAVERVDEQAQSPSPAGPANDPAAIPNREFAASGPAPNEPAERRAPAERTIDPPAAPGAAPVVAAGVARNPDNTAVNERDRNGSTKTPLDQGNNQRDLDISQAIRKAVVGDSGLSFTAKNVKIITEGGRVTLRGPVNTAEERTKIAAIARQVAGVLAVDDQLEVKP